MSFIGQFLSVGENLEWVLKTQGIKLTAIEAVEIDQEIFGRLFGLGAIKVAGCGTSDSCLNHIQDPIAVKPRIKSVAHPVE